MAKADTNTRLAGWFRQWRQPLRKFLIGRRNLPEADLDDVAQEVFLRLMRYDKTDLVEHPQAYVYKIAANVATEWSIRFRNSKPHEAVWLAGLLADDQPEENVAHDLAQGEIERALKTLTPRQRQVLHLFFSEGLGHSEIGQRIGSSPRNVRRIMASSYEQLRQELSLELLGDVTHGHE